MSLRHGRPLVASPGPSVIPDRVLAAMARPMPNIYGGEIVEVSHAILDDLATVARTAAQPFIIIGNGHAAWQMAIANTLSRGDRILALESGRFASAWGEMAELSGVEVELLAGSYRHPVDPDAVLARLSADVDREIRAILVVHTDTASSIRNDIAAIRAAIDDTDHPALLMVDCIASLGCDPYEMDAWGVDVTVAACQKGLMVPPGLSFVWAGPKAIAAYERADLHQGYLDWPHRMDVREHYQLYAGTPPVSHLYAMREALAMIAEEGGIEAVWRRHQVLADAIRAAVEAWSKPGAIELGVVDPEFRSNAVTTVLTGSIDATRLARICEDELGLTLGVGLGEMAGHSFRIGHMGHLNPPMILGLIGSIEAALGAMEAPLGGSGVAAAADVIAGSLR